LEETLGGNEFGRTADLGRSSKGVDGVREGIKGVGVVEWLGTKSLEEHRLGIKGSTVVNVAVRLDNPDKLLHRVVEVELDLVGRRTNRLISGELNLLDQILVRVLGHLSTLIGIKEDIINVKRSGNKRLLVGGGNRLGSLAGSKGTDGPQALTKRSQVKVDLDLVVLKGNKWKGKSWVSAEPEKERNIKSGLRKSVSWGTHLCRGTVGGARTGHGGESRVGDVGKLSGVTNHLEVSSLLLRGHGHLVPDVHPVTILTVDSLTTNLNLNLGNKLLTNIVQPSGVNITGRSLHGLVDLWESHLKVGSVGKITISGDSACNTSTEVGLSGESLLDRLHGEVGVSSVRHLPEGDLRSTGKENVLCAVGD